MMKNQLRTTEGRKGVSGQGKGLGLAAAQCNQGSQESVWLEQRGREQGPRAGRGSSAGLRQPWAGGLSSKKGSQRPPVDVRAREPFL